MPRVSRKTIKAGLAATRHLRQPRGDGTTWYVEIVVPRPLRTVVGKPKLVRSTGTIDLGHALRKRPAIVAELRAIIEAGRKAAAGNPQGLKAEALEWRDAMRAASSEEERDVLAHVFQDRAEALQNSAKGRRPQQGQAVGEEQEEALAPAVAEFIGIAQGQATPLDSFLERWLSTTTYSDRTKADARTALRNFEDWCLESDIPRIIEAITGKVAAEFRDDMLGAGTHRITLNKKLSSLRSYWRWLEANQDVTLNPWLGKSVRRQRAHQRSVDDADSSERPFTDGELKTLLQGKATAEMADLMRIAALSGMRLEEIGQLRVRDCKDGTFNITRGKTPASVRKVPIHPALSEIVASRSADADPDQFLFAAFKASGWDGNRTMRESKRFAAYRQRCGVTDEREGSRRSKVNFHSFRRWFATKAEEAGQQPHVIEAVLGHEGGFKMLQVYSRADKTARMRACVEAVRLPE